MSMSSHLLERAVGLWENGQREQARRIFEVIVHNDRNCQSAWLWYIRSVETNPEKAAVLESFLELFPGHIAGRKALEKLRAAATTETSAVLPAREAPVILRQSPKPQMPRAPSRPAPGARFVLPWALVTAGVCVLLFSLISISSGYLALRSKYESLLASNASIAREYDRLRGDHQQLVSRNLALENEHGSLQSRFAFLEAEHTGVLHSYETLNNEYTLLRGTYDSLYAEHIDLLGKHNRLVGDYNVLTDIAVTPPYIVIHDRMVDTTFYDIDGQLITWQTPFAGLEYGIEHGSYMRRLIIDDGAETVGVYTKQGQIRWLNNFAIFVTPETFRDVVPPLYQKSSNAYEFIYRMWYMIGQLSNYTAEELETPRYSLETLLAGGGDCEDTAILLASLIRAAPVDWYVDLVYIDSNNLHDPQRANHAVVYIDTGSETFIVETTNNEVMLPYENGITGWLASNLDLDNQSIYPVDLH